MYPFVSIIGTGWLGLPLAKVLVQADCQVFGTTTRDEKNRTFNSGRDSL